MFMQGHGICEDVVKGIKQAYIALKVGGMFYTDFVTKDDVTYGVGKEIAPNTFIGGRLREEEIPHYYTTENELRKFFDDYDNVEIKSKVYKFCDNQGIEHIIKTAVVIAVK